MENRPLKEIMETSMNRLKDLVDVNTIIGEKIETADGKTIIPISKVSFGFGSGGTEFVSKSKSQESKLEMQPFGGGGGGGVTITPIGFLVCDKDGVSLLELSGGAVSVDKLITSMPNAISKISDLFSKKNKKSEKKDVTIDAKVK